MLKETNLVSFNETQLTLDSRDVADMMGKNHKELLRDIRKYSRILDKSSDDTYESAKLRSPDFFIPSTYITEQGRELPYYLLTRKGCEMVANKMTGEKGVLFTAAYVARFEYMEAKLRLNAIAEVYNLPTTLSDAYREMANMADEIDGLKEDVKEMQPKADYFDEVMSSPDTLCVTNIAKDYGMSPQKLNNILHELGVQYKSGEQWVLYAKHDGKGYVESEEYPVMNNGVVIGHNKLTKWTAQGEKFIHDTLSKNGFEKIEKEDVTDKKATDDTPVAVTK